MWNADKHVGTADQNNELIDAFELFWLRDRFQLQYQWLEV
jgi:hypothetical protein